MSEWFIGAQQSSVWLLTHMILFKPLDVEVQVKSFFFQLLHIKNIERVEYGQVFRPLK